MSTIDTILVNEGDDRLCLYCNRGFFLHRECDYHTKFSNTPLICPYFIEKVEFTAPANFAALDGISSYIGNLDFSQLSGKTSSEIIKELNEEVDSRDETIHELNKIINKKDIKDKRQKDQIKRLKIALNDVILAKNFLQKIVDKYHSGEK